MKNRKIKICPECYQDVDLLDLKAGDTIKIVLPHECDFYNAKAR